MKYFKHFPEEQTCPICKTNKDAECFLMPIHGTNDGRICEAQPVHKNCINDKFIKDLVFNRELNLIYTALR